MNPICSLYQTCSNWITLAVSGILSDIQQKVHDLFFKIFPRPPFPIPTHPRLPAVLGGLIGSFLSDDSVFHYLSASKKLYTNKQVVIGSLKSRADLFYKVLVKMNSIPPFLNQHELLGSIRVIRRDALKMREGVARGLENFPQIQEFCIDHDHLTIEQLQCIARVPNMRTVTFRECLIEQGRIQTLSSHKNLLELHFLYTDIPDTDLPYIAQLSQLQKLTLSFVESGLEALAQHQNIFELHLLESDISLPLIQSVIRMPKLQALFITKPSSITTQEVFELLASCEHLEFHLNLDLFPTINSPLREIDDQTLGIIATIPKLHTFRAFDQVDSRITDAGIAHFIGHKHLRHLAIRGDFTDAYLQSVARIPHLESLKVDDTTTDEELFSFSHEHLVDLHLGAAEEILPQTLQCIPRNFPNLQKLTYYLERKSIAENQNSIMSSWLNRRKEDIFINTIASIKQLKILHTNIQPKDVQKLRALRPDLEVNT
jgi:hypothetical protein